MKVLGIGSPIIDCIVQVSDEDVARMAGKKGGMELVDSAVMKRLLENDLKGIPTKRSPGGSAGNTTFALAALGMDCAFLGKLGHDELGRYYRESFETCGGDSSHFKQGDTESACCISLVTPDSERTMRTDLGAAMTFSPDEFSTDDFAGIDHVHVESYLLFNRALLMAVLNRAKDSGCTVSIDLGSFETVEASRDILPDILSEYIDLVFANEEESRAFSGKAEPREGLDQLGKFCELAAVKVGREGSWLKHHHTVVHVDADFVASPLDTTAAGDYWAAGFLYGYLNGHELSVCGQMGSVLGAHIVQHLGGSLPQEQWAGIREQINRLSTS